MIFVVIVQFYFQKGAQVQNKAHKDLFGENETKLAETPGGKSK